MGNRLFVGGLPWAMDERTLGDAFSGLGSVVEVKVIRDPETGKSRGFGFIAMSTNEEAMNAVRQMDGAMVAGRRITVREAQERQGRGGPDRGDRPPGGGPGFSRPAGLERGPDDRGGFQGERGPRPAFERRDAPFEGRAMRVDRPPMDRPPMDRPPMDRPPMDRGPDRMGGDRPQGGWGDRGRAGGPPAGGGWGPRPGGPPGPGPGGFGGGGAGGAGGGEGWSTDRGPTRRAPESRASGSDKKKGRGFDDWGGGMSEERPRRRREKGRKHFEDWGDDDDDV